MNNTKNNFNNLEELFEVNNPEIESSISVLKSKVNKELVHILYLKKVTKNIENELNSYIGFSNINTFLRTFKYRNMLPSYIFWNINKLYNEQENEKPFILELRWNVILFIFKKDSENNKTLTLKWYFNNTYLKSREPDVYDISIMYMKKYLWSISTRQNIKIIYDIITPPDEINIEHNSTEASYIEMPRDELIKLFWEETVKRILG